MIVPGNNVCLLTSAPVHFVLQRKTKKGFVDSVKKFKP